MTLWLIILVFALPPLSAYFMYYSGIMPETRMNKGTLIEPQQFPELSLTTFYNQPFFINANSGKWTLLVMVDALCDDVCKKNIYLMRQVKTSLGKDSPNMERLLIVSDHSVTQSVEQFLSDYPDMPVVSAVQSDFQKMSQFFTSISGDVELNNKIFLADPDGRIMMHYQSDFQPKDLLSDLKRLIFVNSTDVANNKM